jgi:uncharacterized membrane protein SirB2
MDDLYPLLRHVHIAAVAASGSLFALRALAFAGGAAWPRRMPARALSWTIDTVLLAAAIALAAIVGQAPFVDGWLTAKVVLLVVYVGLGTMALRPALPPSRRLAAALAALAVLGFIVSIARAHDPLGLLAGLLR